MLKSILHTPYSILLRLGTLAAGIIFLIFLRKSFAGRIVVDPIAFSLFGYPVHWYGLLIALAILIAIPWTTARGGSRRIEGATIDRSVWWMILGGIVGARLLYVVQNLDVYGADPSSIIALAGGGLSIHGALIGGVIGLAIATRFDRTLFWKLADAVVPGLLLGMVLGRFGNFTNHELFGPPTELPWKMFVPVDSRPLGMSESAFYHPTFLYDIILNTVVLLLLLALERRWTSHPSSTPPGRGVPVAGQLTLFFFLGIAITRFIIEFWRLGETAALGLSSAQLVSLLLASIAGTLLVLVNSRHRRLV